MTGDLRLLAASSVLVSCSNGFSRIQEDEEVQRPTITSGVTVTPNPREVYCLTADCSSRYPIEKVDLCPVRKQPFYRALKRYRKP